MYMLSGVSRVKPGMLMSLANGFIWPAVTLGPGGFELFRFDSTSPYPDRMNNQHANVKAIINRAGNRR